MIGYLIISGVISYLVISLIKRKLPLFGRYGYNRLQRGGGAVLLSLFGLMAIPIWFNNFSIKCSTQLVFSFLITFPIAYCLHHSLSLTLADSPSNTPENIPPRKITVANLTLWGILGIFLGIFAVIFLVSFTEMLGLSPVESRFVTATGFFLTIIYTAYKGARATWMI